MQAKDLMIPPGKNFIMFTIIDEKGDLPALIGKKAIYKTIIDLNKFTIEMQIDLASNNQILIVTFEYKTKEEAQKVWDEAIDFSNWYKGKIKENMTC